MRALEVRGMGANNPASVIANRSSLMQQIQDHVRVGYRYWTAGTVTPDRVHHWVEKAGKLYGVYADRNRRARAKRRGEGCAILLMHEFGTSGVLWWVLLVTGGDHAAHQLETLRDAWDRSSRLKLAETGYELCHVTKAGTTAGRPALSFRMTATCYENWRFRIVDTIRRGDDFTIRQIVESLHSAPGFHGIRKQVKACRALLRATWKRSRAAAPPLALPVRVYYLRRRRILRIPLRVWLADVGSRALPPSEGAFEVKAGADGERLGRKPSRREAQSSLSSGNAVPKS